MGKSTNRLLILMRGAASCADIHPSCLPVIPRQIRDRPLAKGDLLDLPRRGAGIQDKPVDRDQPGHRVAIYQHSLYPHA